MQRVRKAWRLVALWSVVALSGGCAKPEAQTAPAVPKTISDYFTIPVGGKPVRMQLAVLPNEQERGLMYRRDLAPDQGMLFIYDAPRQMHFWMRNTPTPLDIGFFDPEGVLVEIYPLQPFDERTVSSHSSQLKFPLEMNQGWFAANGIRPGARLDLAAVAAALKARGFDPVKFGLPPAVPAKP